MNEAIMDYGMLDTKIINLGKATIPTPDVNERFKVSNHAFVDDSHKILIDVKSKIIMNMIKEGIEPPAFEVAGRRKFIYFDPSKVKSALVTCGGLCPGLNDIIRAVVLELYYGYGAKNILGIKYGLEGFIPKYGHDIMELTPKFVTNIIGTGGSILGSSRGPQNISEVVDSIERMNINILFMIGGDGTLKAAGKITDEILKRKLKISIIGIPKTIDNDIYLISRSFGFDTAVDVATQSIVVAHNEASGYPNGIGLIKLMGRTSGFIAATATLAQQDVNFVLVPEVDFDLDGPKGLLESIKNRLQLRHHAVIVVAEGSGQKFFTKKGSQISDESGNIILNDIGLFLKKKIKDYFKKNNIAINLKYIDPSYMIRSLPANSNDNVFCSFLGRGAVHAGMAGKTRLIVGNWNNHFVHVPIKISEGKRKHINPHGILWNGVLESTGQGSLVNE